VKVAFDENIPMAMVRVFETFAKETALKKATGNFTIESAKAYTPKQEEADYRPKNDVPWINRFYKAGGRVIISGNTQMLEVPHERLALIESGMLVIFFPKSWNNWDFFNKCAHLMHWWPIIAGKARVGRKGTFWRVPLTWAAKKKGKLHPIANDDPGRMKLERIEKKKISRVSKKRGEKKPHNVSPGETKIDLFNYQNKSLRLGK
jgi:hypothetical protein